MINNALTKRLTLSQNFGLRRRQSGPLTLNRIIITREREMEVKRRRVPLRFNLLTSCSVAARESAIREPPERDDDDPAVILNSGGASAAAMMSSGVFGLIIAVHHFHHCQFGHKLFFRTATCN